MAAYIESDCQPSVHFHPRYYVAAQQRADAGVQLLRGEGFNQINHLRRHPAR